jgi:hypothetical protein
MIRHDDRLLSFCLLLGDKFASKLSWVGPPLLALRCGPPRCCCPIDRPPVELVMQPLLATAWFCRIFDRLNVGWPAHAPVSILVGVSFVVVVVAAPVFVVEAARSIDRVSRGRDCG